MDILAKLFIKDYKNIDNEVVRLKYGVMCGIFGIITNVIISCMKIITGFFVGSIAITTDGVNNLGDALSSLITLIGFKLSSKKPTKSHPFGYERMEYISGLIVSIIIIGIGALLLESSINKLFDNSVLLIEANIYSVVILILVLSLIGKIIQSLVYLKYSIKISSKTLFANFTDSILDVVSTLFVLIASVVSKFYPNSWIDGTLGIIVSLIIIVNGCKLVKETISPLVGQVPNKEFVKEVREKILSYDEIVGIHDMVIHNYGEKKKFITVHAEIDGSKDFTYCHNIIDNIESYFLNELGINLVIHMDPIDLGDEKLNEIRVKLEEVLKNIGNIKFHDLRLVNCETHTNVIFDVVIPFGFKMEINEVDYEIKKAFKDYNYNLVITYDTDFIGEIYD